MLKVWWVFGWVQYYPSADNFLGSFTTEYEANDYIDLLKKEGSTYDFFDVKNIEDRL